jgi:hypothetical protein
MADLVDSMLRNGFEAAGNYKCWEIPSLIISCFIRPSDQITGVIYDHPAIGIWIDLCVQYSDGGSFTVTNAPSGHEPDHMPNRTKIYCRGCSLDELLKRLSVEIRGTGRTSITKEEFPSYFEELYRTEMKWRIDRGGPTSIEVMRVAKTIGELPDSERLRKVTQTINKIWAKEKNRPKKVKTGRHEVVLPKEFQAPDIFRQKKKQKSEPIPRLKVPALPVYLAFITALAYWCYYGYRYNQAHFPVSITELIIFFSVFVVLFALMMIYREYHRQVRLCPILKRIADIRPGAFLVMEGSSPSLFYAKERWIGKVSFEEGGEHKDAFTRLDAVTKDSMGQLTVSKKTFVSKMFSDKESIPLPESDFSRKFAVSGTDERFVKKLLSPAIQDAILRLEEFGRPFAEIDGNLVKVQIDKDLSSPRKETVLVRFLEAAERIIDATVRQTVE